MKGVGDLSKWHVVAINMAEVVGGEGVRLREEHRLWLRERNVKVAVGHFIFEATVGHQMHTCYFFPPHEVDNAMLFKLTFAGSI